MKLTDTDSRRPENGIVDEKGEMCLAYLNTIPDCWCIKDESLCYVMINEAYRNLLGKSREEILGRKASEILSKDVARLLEKADLTALAARRMIVEELKVGDRIYEVTKFPVKVKGKTVIASRGTEVTENRKAEEALENEKIKFQKVCDNIAYGVILIECNGTIKYLNPMFTTLFGYNSDDVPDGETWFRRTLPQFDFNSELASWVEHSEAEGATRYEEARTRTVICKDGTLKRICFKAVQMTAGDYVVSCEDLTGPTDRGEKSCHIIDHDPLTGLPNGIAMEKAVENAIGHAREVRTGEGSSVLLLLGIEDLKDNGDKSVQAHMLVTVSRVLKSLLHKNDFLYRSGECRFAILFRDICMSKAKLAAERIQKRLEMCSFLLDSRARRLNIALGLALIDGSIDCPTLLLDAEEVIRRVNTAGRDRRVKQMHVSRPTSGIGARG